MIILQHYWYILVPTLLTLVRLRWRRYLNDGDTIKISAASNGLAKLPNQLSFLVGSGTNKARIRFQTNCFRDLAIGDVFGVLTVVGFSTSADSCETEEVSQSSSVGESSSETASLSTTTTAGIVVGSLLIVASVVGIYSTAVKPLSKRREQGVLIVGTETSGSDSHTHKQDLDWDAGSQTVQ